MPAASATRPPDKLPIGHNVQRKCIETLCSTKCGYSGSWTGCAVAVGNEHCDSDTGTSATYFLRPSARRGRKSAVGHTVWHKSRDTFMMASSLRLSVSVTRSAAPLKEMTLGLSTASRMICTDAARCSWRHAEGSSNSWRVDSLCAQSNQITVASRLPC